MLEIRNALIDDLDAVTAVFVACFNAPPWNDGWSFAVARDRLEAILDARHFGVHWPSRMESLSAYFSDKRSAGSMRSTSTCRRDQWRIRFRWLGTDAHDVEIVDYH